MEIYSENLCIQSEYRKIRTRKNSVFGHFLCSGCRQGSRGTKDQLLFDKTVLKDFKKRHINLSMTWIDYKKAYDFVLHSWINECMKLFGIEDNVENFLEKNMEQWKLSLTSNSEDPGGGGCEQRDISGRQSFTTVVCFEYGAFVVDTLEGKRKL